MAGKPIHVKDAAEFNGHIGAKATFGGSTGVVVDFTASCKAFAPMFDAAAAKYPTITFLKVDVDELQEVASQCGIRAMPTVQAYVNASKVDEFQGVNPQKFSAMLETVSQRIASTGGTGRRLGDVGGSTAVGPAASAAPAAADDDVAARRARMAAAAEARARAAAAP